MLKLTIIFSLVIFHWISCNPLNSLKDHSDVKTTNLRFPINFATCPIIDTTLGPLSGTSTSCGLFCTYCRYAGIPYAEPPIGDLRFRAPVPHSGWGNEIRDGSSHGNTCPSSEFLGISQLGGDEDCLFLNIYAKTITPGRRLPVMVWIHGGAFSIGSGNSFIYGPNYIIDENVMMVSINYRLGALGYLSTDDIYAPGNYGLKDAALALQWIHDNIEKFGGDPDNVTIFGESAGAAIVHYLILSPYVNNGLFAKAISQSGSALNPWAFQTNHENIAKQLATNLGIEFTDNEDMINKLREIPASEIVIATGSIPTPIPSGLHPSTFVPTRDPEDIPENERFLPMDPIDIMRSGNFKHVPYLNGFNSHEWLFAVREVQLNPQIFTILNNEPHRLIPPSWNIDRDSVEAQEIINEIRQFDFHGEMLWDGLTYEYSMFNTDLMFVTGIDRTVCVQSEAQIDPVFYYQFSFDGALNMVKTLLFLNDYPGAVHADDLFYLFRVASIPPPLLPNNPAVLTRRRMVRMWTNFAKYGNPTQYLDNIVNMEWWPVTENQEYFHINTTLTRGNNPAQDRIEFWNRLEAKYLQTM